MGVVVVVGMGIVGVWIGGGVWGGGGGVVISYQSMHM